MNLHKHSRNRRSLAIVGAFTLCMMFTSTATATVIVQYDANPGPAPDPSTSDANVADPGTQSWTGGNGMAVNDGGTPAWQTDDTGTAPPSWLYNVPTTYLNQGATDGWTLSWNVKAPENGTGGHGPSQAISLVFVENDLTDLWRLDLGVQADGDQSVQVSSRIGGAPTVNHGSYAAEGEGEVYHLYELVFDPINLQADLFVDGIEKFSNLPGSSPTGSTSIRWGDGSTSTNPGRIANHNLVQWEVGPTTAIPEPSSLALLGIAAAGLVGFGWRKRRTR